MGRCRGAVLVLAALLVSGCALRLQVELGLDADGGGTLAVALVADEGLQRQAAEAGADPLGDLAAVGAGLEDWEVSDEAAGGGRRVRLSTDFADPADLARLSAELAGALSAPEAALLEPFAVTLDDERVTVTGGAGLVPTDAVATAGLEPDEVEALLEEVMDYTVAIELPGPVVESNADAASQRALTWSVPAGQTVSLRAVAERPSQGRPQIWLIAAAVAAILLFAGATAARRRRRRM